MWGKQLSAESGDKMFMTWKKVFLCSCALMSLVACSGADGDLLFFPPPAKEGGERPSPDIATAKGDCVLSYTARLCVNLKGKSIPAGIIPEGGVCAEVPPFPLRITDGTTISLHGDEFPDVEVKVGDLPPLVLNGKGEGTGAENVGEGTIDASGAISLKNFSFFINILKEAAEISDLTLTTGATAELPDLPSISGSPPDASGAMTLVTGTIVGHTFEAADKFLQGASLQATFTGTINPTLDQCQGKGGPQGVQATKITTGPRGETIRAELPAGNRMEVSQGTYLASTPQDVGSKFEGKASFEIKNISSKKITMRIPPVAGPFSMSSLDPLARELLPQQAFVLDVAFRPKLPDDKPGEIVNSIIIGSDLFRLVGRALEVSGQPSIDSIGDDGAITRAHINEIDVGETSVAANTQKDFFLCQKISCHDVASFTACKPCPDPIAMACELLPLAADGKPLGEVDAACKPLRSTEPPLLTIDLKGSSQIPIISGKQVLAVRNRGVAPLTIKAIGVEEFPGSKSKGEFQIPAGAIFIAKHFADIQPAVQKALEGKEARGTSFPITLPPYVPGVEETTAYIVVAYHPKDLRGYDGREAGVGSAIVDKARIRIRTDSAPLTAVLQGRTTIHEVPALELYFKSSLGARLVPEGGSFPLRGLTPTIKNVSFPLFLKLADAAREAMRITAIRVTGEDAAAFHWLDTKEKIDGVRPPDGEGIRCSIPIIDPQSGTLIDEIFDLRPVPLTAPGFDIQPQVYTIDNMPLFGCVNFHLEGTLAKKLYQASLQVEAVILDDRGNPKRNPDGSPRQATLNIKLLAAIEPLKGQFVFRISQTMAVILNPEIPGVSAVASADVYKQEIAAGTAEEHDQQIFTIGVILDPFDEMTIKDAAGNHTVSSPGDGTTLVMRAVDTHPIRETYENVFLYDYSSLIFNSALPKGSQGVFEDFPNVPPETKSNGMRIFTATLSYPGPLQPSEKRPSWPSNCATIDPCSPEDLKKFSDSGVKPGEKGACAFFYASAASFDSPAFHTPDELPEGKRTHLCSAIGQPQELKDAGSGRYTVDGRITVEELGLRLFGPTYFHNPYGPIEGGSPPLDTVLHMAFTTEVIKPQKTPEDPDVIPDERTDLSKEQYKINLTDKAHPNPRLCERNTKNVVMLGKKVSTWKYLAPLLYKDEEATTRAGCPDEGNDFKGGVAFLKGRPVDPEKKTVTFVSTMRAGNERELTFAFRDVQMFIILNGWLCDPTARAEDFEGPRCFDAQFNKKDADGQISIVE